MIEFLRELLAHSEWGMPSSFTLGANLQRVITRSSASASGTSSGCRADSWRYFAGSRLADHQAGRHRHTMS